MKIPTYTGLVRLAAALLLCALVVPLAMPAPQPLPPTDRSIAIAAHGGFFAGGEIVDPGNFPARLRVRRPGLPGELSSLGEHASGATYIEYTRLARPKSPYPLLLIPGGGLSAASFQDTPDGRPGWEQEFLGRGYSVYLVDINRTGRSPWRPSPEAEAEEPDFRSNAFLWETFRIGPPGSYRERRAYRDSLFPVSAFDELAKQAAPRFRLSPKQQVREYDAVIARACPCILVAHSAAGPLAMAAAQRWPAHVKAVVAIEPSGEPARRRRLASKSPHIFVWGDHLSPSDTDQNWDDLYSRSRAYARRLETAGVPVRWLDLPASGFRGNSHMLMMDRNSSEIAAMLDEELARALAIRERQQ